jgi:hypothetical protein
MQDGAHVAPEHEHGLAILLVHALADVPADGTFEVAGEGRDLAMVSNRPSLRRARA